MTTEVQEFKDKRGDIRIRTVSVENGLKLHSSTQGYSNKEDAIKAEIRSALAILRVYADMEVPVEIEIIDKYWSGVTSHSVHLLSVGQDGI